MLPKINRTPSEEISTILRDGVRKRGKIIDLVYKTTVSIPRFAVIVSTKIDKRAVARNCMKRLVREAVQHRIPSMKIGMDGVFVVRGKLPDNIGEIEKLVGALLK